MGILDSIQQTRDILDIMEGIEKHTSSSEYFKNTAFTGYWRDINNIAVEYIPPETVYEKEPFYPSSATVALFAISVFSFIAAWPAATPMSIASYFIVMVGSFSFFYIYQQYFSPTYKKIRENQEE